MKKEILIILILLLIPSILAIDISLSKSQYYPKETLQAELTGNFISLKSDNIFIYQQDGPRPMPIISGLTKQENTYYYYAILPPQQGNYTLKIENTEYIGQEGLTDKEITKEFIIEKTDTNKSLLSINPGFIKTSEEEFIIKIIPLIKNEELTTEIESSNETRTKEISLIPYSEKRVKYSLQGISTNSILKIADYEIPIFITKKGDSFIEKKSELLISPSKLEGSVTSGKDYFFEIILGNNGEQNLSLIELTTESGTINPKSISLRIGESTTINTTISIPKKTKDNFTGEIIIKYNEEETKIPILFKITKDITQINLTGTSNTERQTCENQNGNICTNNQECLGEITPSLNGNCCKGNCIEIKKSGYNLIIGITLLIIVLLIVIFFVWKARKNKGLKNPIQLLKQKAGKDKYLPGTIKATTESSPTQQLKSNPSQQPSTEVSRNLGRV